MPRQQAWLASMENGVLGEARVRAFLLERFWVLARSVDIDGADFFIQLRSRSRFSDVLPPRLGIVQAKFRKDANTPVYVRRRYVADGEVPIDQVFVLICSGLEDAAKLHLLSAQDFKHFPKSTSGGEDYYNLSDDRLAPYTVLKVTAALDKIESAIRDRSEADNDRFLRNVSIPEFEIARGAVAEEWLLPIPNEHGYIPDLLYQLRLDLRNALYGFDAVAAAANVVLKSADAEACARELQGLCESIEVVAPTPWLKVDAVSTLTAAVKSHKRRLRLLKKRGLLEKWSRIAELMYADHLKFFDAHGEARVIKDGEQGLTYARDLALTVVQLRARSKDVASAQTIIIKEARKLRQTATQLSGARELWRYEFDYPRVGAWRELHRLRTELCAAYYSRLIPDDALGELKLPTLMMA